MNQALIHQESLADDLGELKIIRCGRKIIEKLLLRDNVSILESLNVEKDEDLWKF